MSSLFLKISATFLGVIVTLALDNLRSHEKLQKRLNEISPYIYMEIAENGYHIR